MRGAFVYPAGMKGDEMREARLKRIRRFVLRARIVGDHSLSSDPDKLMAFSRTEIKMRLVVPKDGSKPWLESSEMPLLPTEQVESAAARVRPLFLKRDGLHYESVIADLKGELKANGASAANLRMLDRHLKNFQAADTEYPVSKQGVTYEAGNPITNTELAASWLYGKVMHDDEKRQSFGDQLTFEEVFQHATATTCRQIIATLVLLHFVKGAWGAGCLDLEDSIFSDQVTVTASSFKLPGKMKAMVAPATTEVPEHAMDIHQSLDELDLGPEWEDAAVALARDPGHNQGSNDVEPESDSD